MKEREQRAEKAAKELYALLTLGDHVRLPNAFVAVTKAFLLDYDAGCAAQSQPSEGTDWKSAYEALWKDRDEMEKRLMGIIREYKQRASAVSPEPQAGKEPHENKPLHAQYDDLLKKAANLLTNLAQIIDVCKQEWGESWSDWDEQQRQGITDWLHLFYARNTKPDKKTGNHPFLAESKARRDSK